jgi:hypothetical protein
MRRSIYEGRKILKNIDFSINLGEKTLIKVRSGKNILKFGKINIKEKKEDKSRRYYRFSPNIWSIAYGSQVYLCYNIKEKDLYNKS